VIGRRDRIPARPRRVTPVDIAREKVSDRARRQPARRGFPPRRGGQHRKLVPSTARPRKRTRIAPWCCPRCGCGRRGPRLRGYARFRALEQRELARAALRIACKRATQPSRILGRRRFVAAAREPPSRLRAAAGRDTVRRHHQCIVLSGTLPTRGEAARRHAPLRRFRPASKSHMTL
jgi:hypothetical protein